MRIAVKRGFADLRSLSSTYCRIPRSSESEGRSEILSPFRLIVAQRLPSAALTALPISSISPVSLTRTPSAFAAPAPEAGAHTDEILGELGYAAGDIERLRAQGAV